MIAGHGETIDTATVRRWLGILHGDSPGHLQIAHTGDWSGATFAAADLDAAATYVARLDAEGREGIYCRVTSLTAPPEPGKRGGVADSAALPALWADIDIAGPGHAEHDLPPDETAGRQIVTDSGLPEPTIWIHSGGGLYPIWLLDRPWQLTNGDLDQAKTLAKDWQRIIEHAAAKHGWRYGRGVGDLARVLRIPGTINRKEGLTRPCRIIGATPHRYTVSELQDALSTTMAAIAPSTPAPTPQPLSSMLSPVTRPAGAVSPGDDYASRTSWAQILEPAGWTLHYEQDGVTYWTRPGKHTGISASTNALGTDRLHVFTTSASPLEGGESYSKLGALAALQHGGDHTAAVRALARNGYGSPLPDPGAQNRADLQALLGQPPSLPPSAPPGTAAGRGAWTAELDVSNPAEAADWLRDNAGRSRLAGLFRRLDTVVHTPREGEDGYLPLTDDKNDQDGPAQVRPLGDSALASRITFTWGCYRLVKQGEDYIAKPAIFPRPAARVVVDVPDMLPHLRTLRGVIHSPVFRADGTLIETPGYDPATSLLYLPEPGLTVPPISDQPTPADLTAAVALLEEMLAGFPFISEHHKANYLGALLTPLLRALTPPPYKLHAIEAHQPGSGKTLLANLARWIHGGVFRAELPEDDTELRKQITAILSITTGPVVVLDNVSGALRSSTLAGLLTTAQWDDRPLGSTSWTRAANDRLWTITGNNLSIGGDLPRRTLRTVIDPGRPNPELRTEFAIPDLETWVRGRRGELLAAMLTIVRAWVVNGMRLHPIRASDGYAKWVRTVESILDHAGIQGRFDDPSTQIEVGSDDDEWAEFLTAVHRAYGGRGFTAKELLSDVDTGNLIRPGLIPADALPGDLEAKLGRGGALPGLAKTLGHWLRNRSGRWAGGLTVREAGRDATKTKLWQIRTSNHDQQVTPVNPVTSGSPARPRYIDPLQSVTESSSGDMAPAGKVPGMPGLPGGGRDG